MGVHSTGTGVGGSSQRRPDWVKGRVELRCSHKGDLQDPQGAMDLRDGLWSCSEDLRQDGRTFYP